MEFLLQYLSFSKVLILIIVMVFFRKIHVAASTSTASTIIVGAGMSGIMAAKTLSDNGVKDFLILEATNRIGGRMHKHSFAGQTVEMGANWVEGVGGAHLNPIWALAKKYKLRTFYSDFDNISFNIYGQSGGILPQSVAAFPYKLATAASDFSKNLSQSFRASGEGDVSILASQRVFGYVPKSPLQMTIDFFIYDYEISEPPRVTSLKNVEPIATFEYYGEAMYFVADRRGYEYIVHNLAEDFLKSSNGSISDSRLKLNKVVREIQYTTEGVKVLVEDGSVYTAKHAIVSASVGVLQSKIIKFRPDLPQWKLLSIFKWDMAIYTKIFLKFPSKFWPTGPGTEFFLYAHEKIGYYPIWQQLESEFPGKNILLVTVTDDESRRIEQQPDHETKAEIMEVLRNMFGNHIPEAEKILVPIWGKDRFYGGSFSNWPIGVTSYDFADLRAPVGPVYFTGEHTSERFNGYVHGAYLAGIDTANTLLDCIKKGRCASQLTSGENPLKNGSCRAEIQREREIGRQAWMQKVQILEDALAAKSCTL